MALRMAIGASRHHILRIFLVEASLLSLGGGVAGVGLAWLASRIIAAAQVPEFGGIVVHVSPSVDARACLVAIVVTTGTSILVGLAPAARLAATPPTLIWSASGTGGVTRHSGSRSRLVALQFGISISLVLIAGLSVRSALAAGEDSSGLDVDHMAIGRIDLEMQNIGQPAGEDIFREISVSPASSVAGIQAVALVTGVPSGRDGQPVRVEMEFQSRHVIARSVIVSEGFIDALGLTLSAGRAFSLQDRVIDPRVAIITGAVAKALWPNEFALGKRLRLGASSLMTVVGIVGCCTGSRPDSDRPFVFLPFSQNYRPSMSLIVRGAVSGSDLVSGLRHLVARTAPNVAVYDVKPLRDYLSAAAVGLRFAATTTVVVGGLALVIALAGLYGITSYAISERTREFGIRCALGATGTQICRLVLKDVSRTVLLGMVPGTVVTLALSGMLGDVLIGISPRDPLVFITAPLLLLSVGLAAALLPAYRASTLNPVDAIRHE